jgi:MFS family permease
MRLGIVATIVSALVGTALFAGLARQFGTDDKQPVLGLTSGWLWLGFAIIALLSISAPVLTGLQTFLKYSEQAEKHKATAVSYDRLRQRLDVFLLRFVGEPGRWCC